MLLRTSSAPSAFMTSLQYNNFHIMTRAHSQPSLDSSFNDSNNYHSNKHHIHNHHVGSHLSLDSRRNLAFARLALNIDNNDDNGNNNFHGVNVTSKDDDGNDINFIIREKYYQRLLEEDPHNPLLLGNYGEFLYKHSHRREEAMMKCEELYEMAIHGDPTNGTILARYAEIQWDVHKDRQQAKVYYDQAIQSSPNDWYVCACVQVYMHVSIHSLISFLICIMFFKYLR